MFDDVRQSLAQLSLPDRDGQESPDSILTFPDGGSFRIEVSSVNSFETFQTLVQRARKLGVVVNRVTETWGIFRHTEAELKSYIQFGAEEGIEVVFSIGPRASYDTSAARLSSHGAAVSNRLRGSEQLIRAIEDARRAVDDGCENLLVYDEGLLWVLNSMREEKVIPPSIKFKASSHMGHGNPASIRLLEALGADSINPVSDLAVDVIASLRHAVRVPLDVNADTSRDGGMFIRYYEAPELVRVASPVYLKTGIVELPPNGQRTAAHHGGQMAEQVSIICELMDRFLPEAEQSEAGMFDSEKAISGLPSSGGLEDSLKKLSRK